MEEFLMFGEVNHYTLKGQMYYKCTMCFMKFLLI
jgi:hypothetical protein